MSRASRPYRSYRGRIRKRSRSWDPADTAGKRTYFFYRSSPATAICMLDGRSAGSARACIIGSSSSARSIAETRGCDQFLPSRCTAASSVPRSCIERCIERLHRALARFRAPLTTSITPTGHYTSAHSRRRRSPGSSPTRKSLFSFETLFSASRRPGCDILDDARNGMREHSRIDR